LRDSAETWLQHGWIKSVLAVFGLTVVIELKVGGIPFVGAIPVFLERLKKAAKKLKS
jgi:hypothetical protein